MGNRRTGIAEPESAFRETREAPQQALRRGCDTSQAAFVVGDRFTTKCQRLIAVFVADPLQHLHHRRVAVVCGVKLSTVVRAAFKRPGGVTHKGCREW